MNKYGIEGPSCSPALTGRFTCKGEQICVDSPFLYTRSQASHLAYTVTGTGLHPVPGMENAWSTNVVDRVQATRGISDKKNVYGIEGPFNRKTSLLRIAVESTAFGFLSFVAAVLIAAFFVYDKG